MSVADLETAFREIAVLLRTDINRVFPGWMNEAPVDLLRNRKFIVCSSRSAQSGTAMTHTGSIPTISIASS